MADIAFIFHWQPSEMDAMSLSELTGWWHRALERFKAANQTKKPRNV